MPKIIQLDPHVANLIAAGEVVERPASVVKELIENSIDAGARRISVEIQNGGMTFLRITDDGCGMVRADAQTAFLRHATSKLRSKEDLEAIGTLGFRGEALAATAAVSKVDLLTRVEGELEGTRLHLEAGKLLECEEAGCPVGTTIIVRDLFYNTPARMKFMKRDTVEASAVLAAVQKQALAHPEIIFRFLKDGEPQLQTPGDGELLSAIYSVLGRQAAAEMVPVESKWEKLAVSGYVSRPTATRGTRSCQIFYVNHRLVRSKTLTAALEEAYRNQIMVGRFPSCVLNLSIPLSSVDVNVHPAKVEVKFLNEREIFDCVHYGVKGALARVSGQVEMQLGGAGKAPAEPARKDAPAQPRTGMPTSTGGAPKAEARAKQDYFRTMTAEEYRRSGKAQPMHTVTAQEFAQISKVLETGPRPKPSKAMLEQLFPDEAKPRPAAPSGDVLRSPTALPADETAQQRLELPKPAAFRYLGEALRTYILAEQGDQLILIDKHAAHERMNFERLMAQGANVVGQTLLAPRSCRLDPEEAALLIQNRSLLLSLGFDLDDLGEGDVLLRQIPEGLRESDAEAALSELAGHLQDGRLDTPERLREEALHTIACKAAIKAGYITDPAELERLAGQVLSREDLKYCPHGRPICVVLTRRQLEKQFKRIT